MTTNHTSITIAALTFRRQDDLRSLLPALDEQAAQNPQLDVDVLIVDNDTEPSARPVVDAYTGATTVRYVHETSPGISSARNRAMDESAQRRLLVFIDDDELPRPGWLTALVDTWARTGAGGVTGPVYPRYDHEPGEWLSAGGFFVRKQYADGHIMPAASTGNLLLDLDKVRDLGLRFDQRFSLTGGSDTLFTRQLIAGGARIVFAAAAGVVDRVPAQRMTREWVIQRRYRLGNSWSRVEVELNDEPLPRLAARLRLTAQGSVRVLGGSLRRLVGTARHSVRDVARGQRAFHRGRGLIAGAWGGVYVEYKRPDSRTA